MSMIKIDTEKLKDEINEIEASKKSLIEIFSVIKNDNTILKEMWSSRTSDGVFFFFFYFYKFYNNVIDNFDKDIVFLREVVSVGYIENVDNANKQIDEKIAL